MALAGRVPLSLFLLRGAKSGPDDQTQSGIFTFWWLESPNFMTLFLFTFARSQRGNFLKKENQFLKNPKKWFRSFNIKGSPLWIKIEKSQNFSIFWKKIILFYLNINQKCSQLSFDVCILSFAKNFKFCDILLENHHFWPLSFRGL